jgi:hypothetical protein
MPNISWMFARNYTSGRRLSSMDLEKAKLTLREIINALSIRNDKITGFRYG